MLSNNKTAENQLKSALNKYQEKTKPAQKESINPIIIENNKPQKATELKKVKYKKSLVNKGKTADKLSISKELKLLRDKTGIRYRSSKEVEERINEYIENSIKNNKHLTYTGLSLALGFNNLAQLREWKYKGTVSNIIQQGKTKVLEYYEKELMKKNGQVAGIIFLLKNNYSTLFKDKIFTEAETPDFVELDVSKRVEEVNKNRKKFQEAYKKSKLSLKK